MSLSTGPPMLPRLGGFIRRPAARRIAWGITDQALSSGTNFALALLVARSVDVRTFGMYSIAFASYLVVLGVSRSLFTQPYMVRVGALADGDRRRAAQRAVIGGAIVVGFVAAAGFGIAASIFDGTTRATLLAFALAMPGLLLQDAWRLLFIGSGRPAAAAANDLVWALCQAVLVAAVFVTGTSSVSMLVLAWGGAASVAALFGFVQAQLPPDPRGALAWLRRHWDLGGPFLGHFGLTHGTDQLTIYGISAVAGVAAVGAIQAADVLVRPLNFIAIGASVATFPEGVRLRDRSTRALRYGMSAVSGALVLATLALGSVLLVLPDSVGEQLLGENWAVARPILIFLLAQRLFFGASQGPRMGLQILGAAGRALRTQMVLGPITLVATLAGAAVAGPIGAVSAGAMAMFVAAGAWWWRFLVGAREYRPGDEQGRRATLLSRRGVDDQDPLRGAD
jgi:O-antigen/teichoic acid export membrane protein